MKNFTGPPKDNREDSQDTFEQSTLFSADELKSEFASMNWRRLIPFLNWSQLKAWRLVWVQFLMFAFGFPLVLAWYFRSGDAKLEEAVWPLACYFSVVWAFLLHRFLRPQELGIGRIAKICLVTSVAGVAAVMLTSSLGRGIPILKDAFQATDSTWFLVRFLAMTLTVGLIEEIAKAAPVLWMARKLPTNTHPVTVAYLGAISGLAFGASEAIGYSFSYAFLQSTGAIGTGDYLIYQVLRFISLPLLHASFAGTTGYFVGLSLHNPKARRALLIVGLSIAATLHGLYNTFTPGWLGLGAAMLALATFVHYVRSDPDYLCATSSQMGSIHLMDASQTCCHQCGQELPQQARSCARCGTPVVSTTQSAAHGSDRPQPRSSPGFKLPMKLLKGAAWGVAVLFALLILNSLLSGGGASQRAKAANYTVEEYIQDNRESLEQVLKTIPNFISEQIEIIHFGVTYKGGHVNSMTARTVDGSNIAGANGSNISEVTVAFTLYWEGFVEKKGFTEMEYVFDVRGEEPIVKSVNYGRSNAMWNLKTIDWFKVGARIGGLVLAARAL